MEMDYYEALGVKKPEAEETSEAEPVTEVDAEGVGDEPKTQSKEENARFAAARRKAEAERDAAIAEANQKAEERIEEAKKLAKEELLKEQGLTNPYTDEPITTIAEYEAYRQMHKERASDQRRSQMDMTEDEYDKFIEDLPEVQEARKVKEEADKVLESQRQAQYKKWLDDEVKEVSKLNPAIQSLQDLVNDPKYDEILASVQNTKMGILQAYKLAYFDELSTSRGRQQAINQAGKSHMTSTKSRGDGALHVPAEQMDWYKALNPKATEEQISRHYNRVHQ